MEPGPVDESGVIVQLSYSDDMTATIMHAIGFVRSSLLLRQENGTRFSRASLLFPSPFGFDLEWWILRR